MLRDHAALPRAVGFAGSALIALGGLGAGALPTGVPFFAGGTHARIGLVGVYSGLVLLVLGWWWYGRPQTPPRANRNETAELRASRSKTATEGASHNTPAPPHASRVKPDRSWGTLALWTAPLLFAPPMFSRDVYSYLAQGLMTDAGIDVYRHGPAELGGLFAEQVPAIWQHTPSPYGPVFLLIAHAIAAPLGSHVVLGVVVMRLVAVAGLALLAYAVRILATEAGLMPSTATWLAVLNPLTLIHLIGGAHNDALMVGLLAAGLATAVRKKPFLATFLVVAAALVKVPAALGLCAIVLIWAAHLSGPWAQVRAAAGVLVTAGVATVLITAAAGTGYGWISTLSTPISPQNWSLTSSLARLTEVAPGFWRWAGMCATVVVAALVWVNRDRLGPVYGLGIVLVALVAFGPALRPWYLLWGLVPLAAAATHRRVRRLLAAACAVLVLVTLPDGFAADPEKLLLAALGVLIGTAIFLAVRLLAAPTTLRVAEASR